MLTLVCVEELTALRQVEQERRLARMVLLAEVRKTKAASLAAARDAARIDVRSAQGDREIEAGTAPGFAGVRRGLGRKLIATGERLASA